MAVIHIEDVAYVRFRAPDLRRMEAFLTDFGLVPLVRGDSDDTLIAHGAGPIPCVHITERGPAEFAGLGLKASCTDDLAKLAAAERVRVEELKLPGGGQYIRLVDPNGFVVDVIAGQTPRRGEVDGHEVELQRRWNSAGRRERTCIVKRVVPGPSSAVRLGHVVLLVKDLVQTWSWWHERFGLIVSDEVRDPVQRPIALFIRCDRGALPTDHHTLNFAVLPGQGARFHHAAFEVRDLDDLMTGHEHLRRRGHRHDWGIGRHVLGGQVFDYWRDPWGHRMEHWTDGDLLARDDASRVADVATMLGLQWGPAAPGDFV
jgi:catechol 2,3-dioxygenase-like lactoylglutathione lyase family enzyme